MPRVQIIIRDVDDKVNVEIGSVPDWDIDKPEGLSPAQQYGILVAGYLQEIIDNYTELTD